MYLTERKTDMTATYCNPLCVEGVPSGRFLDMRLTRDDPRKYKDYRSISDPSVVYYDGKWILYPSYSLAYESTDFVNWKKIDIGVEEVSYSPAIACHRGKWYLMGHSAPDIYVCDRPDGKFTHYGMLKDKNGNVRTATDCCLFADDTDRMYIYWHGSAPIEGLNCEYPTVTFGAELDPDDPSRMITDPVLINHFEPEYEWQRMGEHNQNARMGWIEGQWMYKKNGRYYLLYSGSGTQYSTYAGGIMYSDEGPLSGFVHQKNHDPLTRKTEGLVRGAGHGCITNGPGGTIWSFYTCTFCFNHLYERRIAMDELKIDGDGELYCTGCTETPQFAPGSGMSGDAGLLPLTFMQKPDATSCAPGRDAIYAVDSSILSWWQPSDDDPSPCITVPLCSDSSDGAYDVSSLRIIWRDVGMETLDGIFPGPFRYTVEYLFGGEWKMLVDCSENTRDLCVDYRQFEPVRARALRLNILGAPEGISPGLCSFTAFGRCVI